MSLIRELYDSLMGKTKNLNIVLYIRRGPCNDKFIKDHLVTEIIQDNFAIVRTRDQLNFMMGGLYMNSNRIVYASEFKHSLSEDLVVLMNPDPRSKNKTLKHINLKEFMKLRDRSDYLKLFQIIIPDAIDLTKENYISGPIGCKYSIHSDYQFISLSLWFQIIRTKPYIKLLLKIKLPYMLYNLYTCLINKYL